MKVRKKILILENSLAITGAFKSIVTMTDHLHNEFEFIYALNKRSVLAEPLKERGYEVASFPFVEVSRSLVDLIIYLPLLLFNAWRISSLCRRKQIETVHVNDMTNLAGVILKMFSRSPKIIYHVRLMPDSYIRVVYPTFMRLIRRYADEVIFVSEAARRESGIKTANTHVIYDALSGPGRHPTKRIEDNGTLRLIYLANFTQGKGQEFAIEAFQKIATSLPRCTLFIAGGTLGKPQNAKFKRKLEEKIAAAGMNDRILIGGFVGDVESTIKSHDILLNFSDSESFSLTCLEALTYGVPVIATNSGGPAELITASTGILVARRDTQAMADAILRLGRDVNLRRTLADEGRRHAANLFRKEVSAEKIAALYR